MPIFVIKYMDYNINYDFPKSICAVFANIEKKIKIVSE